MVDEIYNQAEKKMNLTVDKLKADLARLRTGKATPAILDNIEVDYYGAPGQIKQMANISVPEPRLIVIQPWDRKAIPLIEKAIMSSDLGINPVSDGVVVRLNIPPLTEERRRNLVKMARRMGEDTKVAVRNIRREANDSIKAGEKNGEIPKDTAHKHMDQVQELTSTFSRNIDAILDSREKEIMEV